ncbi:hypothetical protein HCC09_07885 [Streptococcus suis]|nr:hypothetical protein [Streptococcus suis]
MIGQYEQAEIELHNQRKKLTEVKDSCFGIKNFIKVLSEQGDLLTEFDEMLWLSMVDRIVVSEQGQRLRVKLTNLPEL